MRVRTLLVDSPRSPVQVSWPRRPWRRTGSPLWREKAVGGADRRRGGGAESAEGSLVLADVAEDGVGAQDGLDGELGLAGHGGAPTGRVLRPAAASAGPASAPVLDQRSAEPSAPARSCSTSVEQPLTAAPVRPGSGEAALGCRTPSRPTPSRRAPVIARQAAHAEEGRHHAGRARDDAADPTRRSRSGPLDRCRAQSPSAAWSTSWRRRTLSAGVASSAATTPSRRSRTRAA